MKKAIFGLLTLITILSCSKKEEEDPYKDYNGTVMGIRNGGVWMPRLQAVYDSAKNKKRIALFFVDAKRPITATLTVTNISSTISSNVLLDYWEWPKSGLETKDTLFLPRIYFGGAMNEGEATSYWYLSQDLLPFIAIDKCDTNSNTVEGHLEASFRRSDTIKQKRYDTVVFRRLRFFAPIHPYFDY